MSGPITDAQWSIAVQRTRAALGIPDWWPPAGMDPEEAEASPEIRLLARYYTGERTPDLFDAMMACGEDAPGAE